MNIINLFLENKFLREKKNCENEQQEVLFLNYSEMNSVLLLFNINSDGDIRIFENFADILKKDNKKVTLCCFIDQKKSFIASTINKIIIKKEDISFWGKPRKKILDNLLARNFDAVFLLSPKKAMPILYALMHTKAKIRCGGIPDPNLLDFIIDTSNTETVDETYIFENIVRYLKMINQSN